jgi:diaminohydroxyphosphoribosylaminopyrimidine deaminase/5-amino-6-(5-phosphoribosylamino)uracil reductase
MDPPRAHSTRIDEPMKNKSDPLSSSSEDVAYMQEALALARSSLGKVWPNPSVGCLIVKDDEIIGRGVTGISGRPHAETIALEEASQNAYGSTVYVSLEPCCHWGASPPCTEALIQAAVDKVIVAALDPDTRVKGKGMEELRAAGISLDLGLCKEEAEEVNAGFFHRVATGRPLVCELEEDQLKTGDLFYDAVFFDAVLLDLATWLSNSHIATKGRLCVVVDDSGIAPMELTKWPGEARENIWLAAAGDRAPSRLSLLSSLVGRLLPVNSDASGAIKIDAMLQQLGELGLTRIAVDAKGYLATRLRDSALI